MTIRKKPLLNLYFCIVSYKSANASIFFIGEHFENRGVSGPNLLLIFLYTETSNIFEILIFRKQCQVDIYVLWKMWIL